MGQIYKTMVLKTSNVSSEGEISLRDRKPMRWAPQFLVAVQREVPRLSPEVSLS